MTGKHLRGKYTSVAVLLVAGLVFGGCRQDMHDQPRIDPLEAHEFFADGMGARHLPAGTVARGTLREDRHLYEGKDESGELADALPPSIELTPELLERGQDRYEIYCSPCHDSVGSGRGMIVRRGYKQPQPFWEERLRDMPLGYFFENMTQGYGGDAELRQAGAGRRPLGHRRLRARSPKQPEPTSRRPAGERADRVSRGSGAGGGAARAGRARTSLDNE